MYPPLDLKAHAASLFHTSACGVFFLRLLFLFVGLPPLFSLSRIVGRVSLVAWSSIAVFHALFSCESHTRLSQPARTVGKAIRSEKHVPRGCACLFLCARRNRVICGVRRSLRETSLLEQSYKQTHNESKRAKEDRRAHALEYHNSRSPITVRNRQANRENEEKARKRPQRSEPERRTHTRSHIQAKK